MVKTSQVGSWDKETWRFLYGSLSGLCDACGTLFHDRRRLVQYLNCSSRKCLASYIAFAEPLDIDESKSLELKDRVTNKGKNRFAELPAVKVDGPFVPAPDNETLTSALADDVAPLSFSCVGQSFVAP